MGPRYGSTAFLLLSTCVCLYIYEKMCLQKSLKTFTKYMQAYENALKKSGGPGFRTCQRHSIPLVENSPSSRRPRAASIGPRRPLGEYQLGSWYPLAHLAPRPCGHPLLQWISCQLHCTSYDAIHIQWVNCLQITVNVYLLQLSIFCQPSFRWEIIYANNRANDSKKLIFYILPS